MKKHTQLDTLELVDQLKEGGFKQTQAEVLTKSVVKAINQTFESLDLVTNQKLDEHVNRIRIDILKVESELRGELSDFKINIYKALVYQTISMIAVFGGLITLFKFFH